MSTPPAKKVVDHVYCLSRFVDMDQKVEFALPKKTPLDKLLKEQLFNKINPDVIFVVGNQAFGCHGVVMRHFCELYANCLPTGMIVSLPLAKITPDGFYLAYESMLLEEFYSPRGKLLELLQAAHYLFIPRLVSQVFRCLGDRQIYSEMDALATYFEAKKQKRWGIAKLMLTCVHKYFLPLVCTDEFREMDVKCLCKLLTSDSLAVQQEIEVFYSALYWIYSDYDKRKHHANVVLKTVRYVLMPPLFLLTIGAHLHELTPRVSDELLPHLHKAMLFQQKAGLGLIDEDEIQIRHRCWITDPACFYQNKEIMLKRNSIFTPIDFITYLDKLDCAASFLNRIKEN